MSGVWVQQGEDVTDDLFDNGWFGYSVSLSANGTVVAIGALNTDISGIGVNVGIVRVLEWSGSAWIQRGSDIQGTAYNGQCGLSVSLSADGSILAVGVPYASVGYTQVYEWTGSVWQQRGSNIAGGFQSGYSVSLSDDGSVVAIGAPTTSSSTGIVYIYEWNGSIWTQRGSNIVGEAAGDRCGWSVALSANGSIVAIGAPYNSGSGAQAGQTRVYAWNGAAWVQLGTNIDGEVAGDNAGWSVALSANGSIVAIGAPNNYGGGIDSGQVRVYEWNGAAWVQRGADIDGLPNYYVGSTIALSNDGNTVAVCPVGGAFPPIATYSIRVYRWSGSVWNLYNNDITVPDTTDSNAYYGVSLSADGNAIAVGIPTGPVIFDTVRVYYADYGPNPPTNVVVVSADGQVTVSWSAPVDGSGSPVTSYTVTASPGGATVTVDATNTAVTITGLTNGVTYTFSVVATNSAGSSAPATSAEITPYAFTRASASALQYWPSAQDRTENLRVPNCQCVDTRTRYTSQQQRLLYQKAKLVGNCCATSCLESLVVSGGAGYNTSSTLVLDGGVPYTTPILIKVTAVDVSGAITAASVVSTSSLRYKSVPAAPYTTTVLTGPTDASGAVISTLTWSVCYPCPY